MIVSFHPRISGDVNLSLNAYRSNRRKNRKLLQRARGVILPQSCGPEDYWLCKKYCDHVFPNYTWRFGFEGKRGNSRLFSRFGAPQPLCFTFGSTAHFRAQFEHLHNGQYLPWPAVVKPDRGGGGYKVRLVRGEDDLNRVLRELEELERKGQFGFVLQQYYRTGSRDLRIAVVGDRLYFYWRCQPDGREFRTNLGRGAKIVDGGWPEQQKAGLSAVHALCRRTGLNLAAFDLMFSIDRDPLEPLFLEINFCFGRKGIGGSQPFQLLLLEAVDRWRQTI